MPTVGKVSLTIDEKVWARYKEAFSMNEDYLRSRGIRSATELAERVLAEALDLFLPKPRFKHINMFEDHVKIYDSEAPPSGRYISVYFKRDERPWCEFCEAHECIHIDYVWSIPEVERILTEAGVRRWGRKPPWEKGG